MVAYDRCTILRDQFVVASDRFTILRIQFAIVYDRSTVPHDRFTDSSRSVFSGLRPIYDSSQSVCDRLRPIYDYSRSVCDRLRPVYCRLRPTNDFSQSVCSGLRPIYDSSRPICGRLLPVYSRLFPVPVYDGFARYSRNTGSFVSLSIQAASPFGFRTPAANASNAAHKRIAWRPVTAARQTGACTPPSRGSSTTWRRCLARGGPCSRCCRTSLLRRVGRGVVRR